MPEPTADLEELIERLENLLGGDPTEAQQQADLLLVWLKGDGDDGWDAIDWNFIAQTLRNYSAPLITEYHVNTTNRCPSVKVKVHTTSRSNPERTKKPSTWQCFLPAGHKADHETHPRANQSSWPRTPDDPS